MELGDVRKSFGQKKKRNEGGTRGAPVNFLPLIYRRLTAKQHTQNSLELKSIQSIRMNYSFTYLLVVASAALLTLLTRHAAALPVGGARDVQPFGLATRHVPLYHHQHGMPNPFSSNDNANAEATINAANATDASIQ